MKHYANILSIAALSMQIVLILLMFYGFWTIVSIKLDLGLPTPSCPNGAETLDILEERGALCDQERADIYVPDSLILLTRLAIVGVLICLLSGGLIQMLCRGQKLKCRALWKTQLIAFGTTVIILVLLENPVSIIKFLLYGNANG